jgi:hypothetical protein
MYFVVYVHFVGVLKTKFMKKCTEWKAARECGTCAKS